MAIKIPISEDLPSSRLDHLPSINASTFPPEREALPASAPSAELKTPYGPDEGSAEYPLGAPKVFITTKNSLDVLERLYENLPSILESLSVPESSAKSVINLAVSLPLEFLNRRVKVPSFTPSSYLNLPDDSDPKEGPFRFRTLLPK